ncbi:cation:proton antiporter [Entomospira culicis]|uniref:Sodium:proton antiporter n=1 Tax=Entomospira culicis TaxID=2719989 RepID=A0A968GFN5_9SPIO|nr:cation:proton antiporter [Entomospira culicis]NIZ19218.1 sodium:proton antiporter [Entomospira culicis]NIZ69432.1 sodium:proton antiporter [Entomospira culicis]WDI36548.1 cation:proton antiporter [Entomospira culicis]WDI38174.1 cation:proton antiporter [Entomospira culicis]
MLLFSLGGIFLIGAIALLLSQKFKLPAVLVLLVSGILIAQLLPNLLPNELLQISPALRKFALLIILLRVGLDLELRDLKALGATTLKLTLLPALFEIGAYLFLAHHFLGLSLLESALLGTVIAAVSPAIIVPHMLRLIHNNKKSNLAKLIMSAASLDDIFVIILFSALLTIALGQSLSLLAIGSTLLLSILFALLIGYGLATILNILYKRYAKIRTQSLLIIIAIALLLGSLEELIRLPFSGLIAVIFFAIQLDHAIKIAVKQPFATLWQFAQIWLFVLVGAQLNLNMLNQQLAPMLFVIILALGVRIIGVFVALIRSKFSAKEKLFCAISYLPKATVQASIGALALEAGLASGELILTMAILAILLTAPLGAMFMEWGEKKLLS